MSVILQSQPEAYGLAYNDNPFVFFSTAYTATQRFKVVILPTGYPTVPALATVRVWPRIGVTDGGVVQENKAFYDPSEILQSQIAGTVAIPAVNHPTLVSAVNMHTGYNLFIQEEDKVGGVYVGGASLITDFKSVWNGVRDKIDWLDFDYTDYDMTTGAKWLTDAPDVRYINSSESAFLSFLISTPSSLSVVLKGYDSTGLITNGVIDLLPTEDYNRIAIGTYDLENSDASDWSTGNPTTFLTGVSYYTVQLSGIGLTKTVTFNVDAQCSKYSPIRLTWLNRLGGFDSFNFNMKSEDKEDIKRASYKQEPHRFTGTNWTYDKQSRGTTDYNIKTQSKLTINTGYLTDAESVWMEDFASSPVIFQEVGNELIAMSGKAKRIATQTSLNDKLKQYTFELDYALSNDRQRG